MKRLLPLLLTLLLTLSLATPAFADVLWEPEDSFYQKHAADCSLLQRRFYTNGDEGFVNFYTSPESDSLAGQMTNGVEVYIYWQYKDWGYVEAEKFEGWIPLSQLQLIYDYLAFEEAYGDQFVPYDESSVGPLLENLKSATTLAMWPYPGAEQPTFVWQDASNAIGELLESGFGHTYTDEQGLTWAFRSYLWGDRNFWVCLDAPAGRDDDAVVSGEKEIPVRDVGTVELTPAKEPKLPLAYTLVFVAGMAIATLSVYFVGKKYGPKKKLN